jgi:hypothetical protein
MVLEKPKLDCADRNNVITEKKKLLYAERKEVIHNKH